MVRKLNEQSNPVGVISNQIDEHQQEVSSDLLGLLHKNISDELAVTAAVISCKAEVKAHETNTTKFLVQETQTGSSFYAKLASSCLQVPRDGDIVFVQIFPDKSAYIMAILESVELIDETTTLRLPKNTIFQCEGVIFDTSKFQVSTQKFFLNTSTAYVDSVSYQQTGTNVHIEATRIAQTTKVHELVAEESKVRVMNADKFVSGTDKVKALNINYSAEAVAKLSGSVTMLNGRELLKSDGKLMVVG